MFQIPRPLPTATVSRAPELSGEEEDDEILEDTQEVQADVTAAASTSTAQSSSRAGAKKVKSSKPDDLLTQVVQQLATRRPVVKDLREAMRTEHVDRRTMFCNYLGSEAREMCEEDWMFFQGECFRSIQAIRERVQNRTLLLPPPQHVPLIAQTPQIPQYQPQQQQQQQTDFVYHTPQGPSINWDTHSGSSSGQHTGY